MKLEATAKMVPARKVSTVSWRGSTHERPFSLMNGTIASYTKLSTTQSSRRTRSSPPAISGAYSLYASGPTVAVISVLPKL